MQVAALAVEGAVVAASSPGGGPGCAAYSSSLSKSKPSQFREAGHSPHGSSSPPVPEDSLECTSAARPEFEERTEQLPTSTAHNPLDCSSSPTPVTTTRMHSPAGRWSLGDTEEKQRLRTVSCPPESEAPFVSLVDTTSGCAATACGSAGGRSPVRGPLSGPGSPKGIAESSVEHIEGLRQSSLSTPSEVLAPPSCSRVSSSVCVPVTDAEEARCSKSETLTARTARDVSMGIAGGENFSYTPTAHVVGQPKEAFSVQRRPGSASCTCESSEAKEGYCSFLASSFRSLTRDQVADQSESCSLSPSTQNSPSRTQLHRGGGGNPGTLLLPIPTRRRDLNKADPSDEGEDDSSSSLGEVSPSQGTATGGPSPEGELHGPVHRGSRPTRSGTHPPGKEREESLCPHLAKRVSFGSPLSVEVHQYSYVDGSKLSGGSVTSSQDSSNSSLGSLTSSPSTQCLLLPPRENSSPIEECSFSFVRQPTPAEHPGGFLSPTRHVSNADPLSRSPSCLSYETTEEGVLPLVCNGSLYSPVGAEEEHSYSDSSGCMTRRHSDTSGRGNDFPSFRLFVGGSTTPERCVPSPSPALWSPVVVQTSSPVSSYNSPHASSSPVVAHVRSCRRISPRPLLPTVHSGHPPPPLSPSSAKPGGIRSSTPGATTPSPSKHAHGLRLLVSSPTGGVSRGLTQQLTSIPQAIVASPTIFRHQHTVSTRTHAASQVPDASPSSTIFKARVSGSHAFLVPQPRNALQSALQRDSRGSPNGRPRASSHLSPQSSSMDKTRGAASSSMPEPPVKRSAAGPTLPVARPPQGESPRGTDGSRAERHLLRTICATRAVSDGEGSSPFTPLCVSRHNSSHTIAATSLSPQNAPDIAGLQHQVGVAGLAMNLPDDPLLPDCAVTEGGRNDLPKDFCQSPTASVSPSRPLASVRGSWCDVGFLPGRA